jgi:hypothetical protein
MIHFKCNPSMIPTSQGVRILKIMGFIQQLFTGPRLIEINVEERGEAGYKDRASEGSTITMSSHDSGMNNVF